ncbi:MAG: hypothetical protein U1C73_15550 [Dietzia sp.]|nr:hypothetical protein [Dietzia sp.]
MPLPPARDDQGEVISLEPEDLFRYWASAIAQLHAGGWHPESIPGAQAMAEFEAFVRETQARAVESFVRGWQTREGLTGGPPWWVETKAEEYAEAVRNGHTDLSGNSLAE